MTKKHALQYFICSLKFKSHNFQTESHFKHVASAYRGSTTLYLLVLQLCLILRTISCKVEAHIMPDVRETWAAHTASGYYIGNAWEHYRCYKVYISLTKCTRILETVFFCHKYLTMPTITLADALLRQRTI
jgi:hypothetical protein